MNPKVWASVLALVMFLAGMAAANLWQGTRTENQDPYQTFADRFEGEFELSPKRAGYMRELVTAYRTKVQRIKDRYGSSIDPDKYKELEAEAQAFSSLLRDKVLGPRQREHYDRLLAEPVDPIPPR